MHFRNPLMLYRRRIAAALALTCATLTLTGAANAVDLRDWGRKFPTSERFVVLASFNNEAVLDKETQLVWQAIVNPTPALRTWPLAHIVCHISTTGGRRGWRLPTFTEIASIFGTDGVKATAFNGVPNDVYWTATDHPSLVGYAMVIMVPSGNYTGTSVNKNEERRFWCVRGPA